MPKIKIEKELYERVKKIAEEAGYSSVEELITTVLEREISKLENIDDDDDLIKRMQGLGYIS